MISAKAILILEGYEIEARSIAKRRASEGVLDTGRNKDDMIPLKHVMTMCRRARQMFYEGDIEKANRWLGFIQGVLWMEGVYEIDAMRRHNK